MKRRTFLITLSLLATIFIAIPVLAASYKIPVAVTENGTGSYDMLAVGFESNNEWMADNGFMTATGLDTRMETLGGSTKPHMVTENMTWLAIPVAQSSQTNLFYTTFNTLLSAFKMVFGYGGYFTTSDHATIELSDNFTVELSGWVDTGAGADKNLVIKDDAFKIYVSTTVGGTIISDIINPGAEGIRENYEGSVDASGVIHTINWEAQTITHATDFVITKVEYFSAKDGTPNDATVTIRPTTAGVPDAGGDLTSGSASANGWAGNAWNEIDVTDYTLTGGVTYAYTFAALTGSAGNNIRWIRDESAPTYANGTMWTSANSGVDWTQFATKDQLFRIYGKEALASSVSAAGVTSGERLITVTYDGADHKIFVDTVEEDSNAYVGSVLDNANDWIFGQENVMPYTEYITIDIAGVEITKYEPVDIIAGTVLPDETGSNTGNITWGTNPASIGVIVGSMVSGGQPAIGVTETRATPDILPATDSSDWFVEPDVSGTLLTNPLRPLVTILSDTTTLTESQAWIIYALAFILLLAVGTIKAVKGHLLIAGIVVGASIGACVALTIFPFWTLILIIGCIWGGIVAERTPSL